MAERRVTPRARLTISCLESEWERIREVAESRGVSINDHVISAGLNVELDPAQTDAPALALSEAEQRRLLDRVDRLAESMLSATSGGSIARLRQSVKLLLMTTLHDLVWQGREPRPAGPHAPASRGRTRVTALRSSGRQVEGSALSPVERQGTIAARLVVLNCSNISCSNYIIYFFIPASLCFYTSPLRCKTGIAAEGGRRLRVETYATNSRGENR